MAAIALTIQQADSALAELSEHYDLIGPARVPDAGAHSGTDLITYRKVTSISDLVLDEKSYFSPKEWLFPIRETLFQYAGDSCSTPPTTHREQLLFVRPCDVHGIDRLDRIFLQNGSTRDPGYEARRRLTHLCVLECTTGFDSCFCSSMGTNRVSDYACAIRINSDGVVVDPRLPDVEKAFSGQGGKTTPFELQFVEQNQEQVTVPDPDDVDAPAVIEHDMWNEYSDRCIACGRCNTSCVTCSCFSMQDVQYDRNGDLAERRRVWAGCHIDGFTDMAGGHSFRRKYGDRMRFKTLHKVYDYHKRFGAHMCVGCGRCTDVCPVYISFPACIRKYAAAVKETTSE